MRWRYACRDGERAVPVGPSCPLPGRLFGAWCKGIDDAKLAIDDEPVLQVFRKQHAAAGSPRRRDDQGIPPGQRKPVGEMPCGFERAKVGHQRVPRLQCADVPAGHLAGQCEFARMGRHRIELRQNLPGDAAASTPRDGFEPALRDRLFGRGADVPRCPTVIVRNTSRSRSRGGQRRPAALVVLSGAVV